MDEELLERHVTAVATLGTVVATVTGQHRDVRQRASAKFLHTALRNFTWNLRKTLDHGDVTSLVDFGVPSLSQALAALEPNSEASWDNVRAAAKAWRKLVAILIESWEELAKEATKLCDACIPTAPTQAGNPQDEATHQGTDGVNLVAMAQQLPGVLDGEALALLMARHNAWEAAATHKEELTTGKEEPATNEEEPATSQEEPAANEELAISEEEVAISEEEVTTSKEEPATSEEEVATSEEEPATSEEEPATSEDEPATSKEEPATSEEEVATSEEEVATSEEEVATSEEEVATSEEETATSKEETATSEKETATSEEELATSGEEVATSEEAVAIDEAVVATSQAGAATRRGHWAEAALEPLKHLVAACDKATLFLSQLQWLLDEFENDLEWTWAEEASPHVLSVHEALVSEVAEFEQLWDASAHLAEDHLLRILDLIDNLLLSPYGGPGGPGGSGGPGSRAVDERCQEAIKDIPRLLQGQ